MVRNNNCLLSSIFPAGEGGVSVPRRSSQDYRDGFFWYSAQASFSWGSSLSRSVGFVSLSGKASLVSISAAILFLRSWHVYIPLEFEFRGKSRRKWHLMFPTLYIIIVDRVNLNKLLQIITKLRWSNKDNNN